jgi:hypothetical protein
VETAPISCRIVRSEASLFLAVLFVYAYFFQGYGYNQDAHFDTVRAIVERGTLEIGPYVADPYGPGFTGDVSRVDERVYSSKPPGLALVVLPAYAIVYGVERVLGIDPTTAEHVTVNQWLCTIWAGALPGAVLAVALFRYFRRRRGLGECESLLLATGFAFGTLMFPYGGMLITQTLMAMCLFVAWMLIDDESATDARATVAGLLLGITLLAEISAAPLVLVYALVTWLRRPRAAVGLLIGPAAAVIILLIYQRLVFGGALSSSYSRVNPDYLQPDLFLGHFHWPDLRRLYWLSIHPVRGLLYCCPILFIPILAFLAPRDWTWPRRHGLIPAAVIADFLLFNLTYHGWTGGFGVGPRYLVPALPFMMVFAPAGYRRFPRISLVLIIISVAAMLAVTAVRAQWEANLYGPPRGYDPVAESLLSLTKYRHVARDRGSSNLGLTIGLRNLWSLTPPLLIIAAVAAWIVRCSRHERHA